MQAVIAHTSPELQILATFIGFNIRTKLSHDALMPEMDVTDQDSRDCRCISLQAEMGRIPPAWSAQTEKE
jgi:hypothetical protein